MRKGISPVIASIVVILIVISLGGAYSVFSGRISGEQIEAGQEQAGELTGTAQTRFSISAVEGQDVIIENLGSNPIEPDSLAVTLDDQSVNYTLTEEIPPGEEGRLHLEGLWLFGPGERTLEVRGAALGTTQRVKIEPAEGALLDIRFEEGSGNTAFDLSEHNNHGDLEPNKTYGPEWTTGKFGGGLEFDGVDDYVIFDGAFLGRKDTYTVATWFSKEGDTPFAGLVNDLTGNIYSSRLIIANNKPSFDFDDTSGNSHFLQAPVVNSTWHHLHAIRDTSEGLKLYLDGELEDSDPFTGTEEDQGDAPPNLGLAHDNSYLDGRLDNVLVYNRALTPNELYVLTEA